MSDWITIQELLARWKIREFELLEHLRKGLQPYSKYGFPIKCPSSYNPWHQLCSAFKGIETNLQILDNPRNITPRKTKLLSDGGEENARRKLLQEKEEASKAVKAFEKARGDENPDSWKFFNLPESEEEVEKVINILNGSFFKLTDVELYEQDFLNQPSTDTLGEKKLRPSQKHRIECRKVAKQLWEKDPEMTIEGMTQQQEILDVSKKKDGQFYSDKTIRNWIKDLCPNRKPGRRPTK